MKLTKAANHNLVTEGDAVREERRGEKELGVVMVVVVVVMVVVVIVVIGWGSRRKEQ